MAILLFSAALPLCASARGAAEEGEAKFIRLTHQIEQDPLGDGDKSVRAWLLKWAIDSQDITVVVCDILGTISGDNAPYSDIYTIQLMFGNAAYQISHPDKRGDLLATQSAGARSSLAAYTSVLAGHPEARVPHLDDLIDKDKAGELEASLAPIVAEKCNKPDSASSKRSR